MTKKQKREFIKFFKNYEKIMISENVKRALRNKKILNQDLKPYNSYF
ncbi:MAG: hypothetical protein WC827_04180 [Candidatus Paceibacterota bacterium]|jgi:hypothetical protein